MSSAPTSPPSPQVPAVATAGWASVVAAVDALSATEASVVEPSGSLDRERWLDARDRALRSVPALSMLEF